MPGSLVTDQHMFLIRQNKIRKNFIHPQREIIPWSNSTLNTLKDVEIFITGILMDFTNLKMQRVLGKHANRGTKSIKTVKLAPVKGNGRERLLPTLLFWFFFLRVCLCLDGCNIRLGFIFISFFS